MRRSYGETEGGIWQRGKGVRGGVRPTCLPGWQSTLLDVTFTVCWRFVWKPSHLWLAVWLMSLSALLCSLRRGHGLIPGITDLFSFGANLQISQTPKYKSEHPHTRGQTHVRTPCSAYKLVKCRSRSMRTDIGRRLVWVCECVRAGASMSFSPPPAYG